MLYSGIILQEHTLRHKVCGKVPYGTVINTVYNVVKDTETLYIVVYLSYFFVLIIMKKKTLLIHRGSGGGRGGH